MGVCQWDLTSVSRFAVLPMKGCFIDSDENLMIILSSYVYLLIMYFMILDKLYILLLGLRNSTDTLIFR